MKTSTLIAAVLFTLVLVCCMHENRRNSLNESKPAMSDLDLHDAVFELVGGIDPPVITQGDPGTEGQYLWL